VKEGGVQKGPANRSEKSGAAASPRARDHYDLVLVSYVGPPEHPVIKSKWCCTKWGQACPNKKHQETLRAYRKKHRGHRAAA
jgi:hypothetical protein